MHIQDHLKDILLRVRSYDDANADEIYKSALEIARQLNIDVQALLNSVLDEAVGK